MALPGERAGAPRIGWGPECVALVLAIALAVAWAQRRDAPLLGPARRAQIASRPPAARGEIARLQRLAGEASLREAPGEAGAEIARLGPGRPLYVVEERGDWKRVAAIDAGGETVSGWLPADRGRDARSAEPLPEADRRLREALAAEIERVFLGRYLYATVRAAGEQQTVLRVRASRVRPPMAQLIGRELDWSGLASAGFLAFELTDGDSTYRWTVGEAGASRAPST